jgi:putative hydrolase of the HAD superfamily
MVEAGLRGEVDLLVKELDEVVREFGSNDKNHLDKLLLRSSPEDYTPINPLVIVAAGIVAYHQTKSRGMEPFEDVVEFFKMFDSISIPRGVITSGIGIKQAEKLIRLDLLQYFDPRYIVITDQIGIGKPNPKLYRTACELAGVAPEESIMVGDHPLLDIDSAKLAGLHTIWVKRGGKYANTDGKSVPDYEIRDFWDLMEVLRDDFGFELTSSS